MRMDTRQKIYDLLNKISSQRDLIRIYKFMQYVYLHTSSFLYSILSS